MKTKTQHHEPINPAAKHWHQRTQPNKISTSQSLAIDTYARSTGTGLHTHYKNLKNIQQ